MPEALRHACLPQGDSFGDLTSSPTEEEWCLNLIAWVFRIYGLAKSIARIAHS